MSVYDNITYAWNENFPKGYGHTSIAYLKRYPGFEDAKKGNINAARFVVNGCVKHDRIYKLKEQHPDAVLLPVIGINQLPLALAMAIGLPIWYKVHLLHFLPRKLLCAIERLLDKPIFFGHIKKSVKYILVDDVITQGGTISALRRYVLANGGKVVAVVALAFAIGSHNIAPVKMHIVHLRVKFGFIIDNFLYEQSIAATIYELTDSQIKYLLRFSSVGNIKKKIERMTLIAK
jgi:orotate phosphoribosyltransferase-like protein